METFIVVVAIFFLIATIVGCLVRWVVLRATFSEVMRCVNESLALSHYVNFAKGGSPLARNLLIGHLTEILKNKEKSIRLGLIEPAILEKIPPTVERWLHRTWAMAFYPGVAFFLCVPFIIWFDYVK